VKICLKTVAAREDISENKGKYPENKLIIPKTVAARTAESRLEMQEQLRSCQQWKDS